jgi:hypothetical protein
MRLARRGRLVAAAVALATCVGCAAHPPEVVAPMAPAPLTAIAVTAEDTTHKEDLRMVPPEAYMRTYLQLFGGLAPQDVQKLARAKDGSQLFDTWDDYVSALGFPDYRLDIPRQTQTNALMIATFERLGVALCDRALEHDLTFLGYPAALAPPDRTSRFFNLYRGIESDRAKSKEKSRFSPSEAGWAAVCYGLVRHPEFHLY